MKKVIAIVLSLTLALGVVLFAACAKKTPGTDTPADLTNIPDGAKIAVPNDATNEARALLILDNLGVIKLKADAGVTATVRDIEENPHNVEILEVEAAQIPNFLSDVAFGVINSNYALAAGLNPMKDAVAVEGAYSPYANILAVKKGNEEAPETKALVAALSSKKVADFIAEKYNGAVISVVENPGDGFDPDLDYTALAGKTVTVAASPTPHAEILAVAKEILAEKNVTLEVIEYTDYIQPNLVVDAGDVYANYFQHTPYLEDFNASNGTALVSAMSVHVEPMGVYSANAKTASADATLAPANDANAK